MKKTVVALAVLAVIATFSAASTAGFSGKASKPNSGTSSIALATVTSADGTAKLASAAQPSLGSRVTFATTIEQLAGSEYPMIDVTCYQDVNGDGRVDTSLLGPDIVYSDLDKPDATYTLGGYSSIWTNRGGGDATCRADLVAIGWKGGKESARNLSTTGQWLAQG